MDWCLVQSTGECGRSLTIGLPENQMTFSLSSVFGTNIQSDVMSSSFLQMRRALTNNGCFLFSTTGVTLRAQNTQSVRPWQELRFLYRSLIEVMSFESACRCLSGAWDRLLIDQILCLQVESENCTWQWLGEKRHSWISSWEPMVIHGFPCTFLKPMDTLRVVISIRMSIILVFQWYRVS